MNRQHVPHGSLSRDANDALLLHLTRERQWLAAARSVLLTLRRSAVAGDLEALDAALHEQSALTAARDELSAGRRTVLDRAAAQLGLATRPATLGAIASRLPPDTRKPIVAARRELMAGARGLRTLAAGTLAIVAHKRQIVNGILGDLLGESPGEARYAADGRRQEGPGRPLVECRT